MDDWVYPEHCKDTPLHYLAERIIVFVSDDEKERRLKEFKSWATHCNYPESLDINQSNCNPELQGPVPFKGNSKSNFLVTAFYGNQITKNG